MFVCFKYKIVCVAFKKKVELRFEMGYYDFNCFSRLLGPGEHMILDRNLCLIHHQFTTILQALAKVKY